MQRWLLAVFALGACGKPAQTETVPEALLDRPTERETATTDAAEAATGEKKALELVLSLSDFDPPRRRSIADGGVVQLCVTAQ